MAVLEAYSWSLLPLQNDRAPFSLGYLFILSAECFSALTYCFIILYSVKVVWLASHCKCHRHSNNLYPLKKRWIWWVLKLCLLPLRWFWVVFRWWYWSSSEDLFLTGKEVLKGFHLFPVLLGFSFGDFFSFLFFLNLCRILIYRCWCWWMGIGWWGLQISQGCRWLGICCNWKRRSHTRLSQGGLRLMAQSFPSGPELLLWSFWIPPKLLKRLVSLPLPLSHRIYPYFLEKAPTSLHDFEKNSLTLGCRCHTALWAV